MRKDLLALAERIRELEIELSNCSYSDRDTNLSLIAEVCINYKQLISKLDKEK